MEVPSENAAHCILDQPLDSGAHHIYIWDKNTKKGIYHSIWLPNTRFLFVVYYTYVSPIVFGLFPSGVKQLVAIFFPLSQKLFHPGVNVYLSAEVGVGKKKSIVTFYFYTSFFLEVWDSC